MESEPALAAASTDTDSVLVTHVERRAAMTWSRRRAFTTGAIVGLFFGIIFFIGYGATSAWICSARLDCGHWAPITIVSASGALSFTVLGGITGLVLHKLYGLFRVV